MKQLTAACLMMLCLCTMAMAELTPKEFIEQFTQAAFQKNAEKILKLVQENPETAKIVQINFKKLAQEEGENAQAAKILDKILSYVLAETSKSPEAKQMDKLNEEGERALYTSNYPEALAKWQEGLKIAEKSGDKKYISQFIGNIGAVYDSLGQYEMALGYYEKALDIHKKIGDRQGEGHDLGNIGNIYRYFSQYNKALGYYERALDIHKKIGDRRGVGSDLTNIGIIYGNFGQYDKALGYYEKALAIKRETGNRRGEGNNLTNIGIVYDSLGQYEMALGYYEKAWAIHKETGNRSGEGSTIGYIGVVYDNLSQYEMALGYYEKALAIAKEIGNRRGEGNNLTNIGIVYNNLGQYEVALGYYEKALAIAKEIGNRRDESNNLTNIGVVYDNLGQYEVALGYYEKALAIAKEIGNRSGEGNNLTNIGLAYWNLGQYEVALGYYEKALAIDKEISDRRGQSNNLANIGIFYHDLGQYDKALGYYEKALAIFKEIGDRRGEGSDLGNIGLVYDNLGQYDKALGYYEKALAIHKEIKATDALWIVQCGLAETEAKLKQYKKAETHYKEALSTIEILREQLSGKDDKLSFMQDKLYVYDEFIEFYQNRHKEDPEKGFDRKAIELFERKQGRIFLEEMGKSGSRHFADLPDDIRNQEISLDNQIQQTMKQLSNELSRPEKDQNHTKIQTLQDRISELKEKETALKARIKKEHPDYYALKYPTPVKLAELQKDVLKAGEGMLIYNVMKNSVCLWFVSRKEFLFSPIEINGENLYGKIKVLRNEEIDGMMRRVKMKIIQEERQEYAEESLSRFSEKSAELAELLIPENVRPLLADIKTLYIVPTGSLYDLPFETLKIEDHYLVENYALSYLSSASLLKNIRDAQARRRKDTKREPLLAFADPIYSVDGKEGLQTSEIKSPPYQKSYRDRLVAYIGEKGELSELLETRNEITMIADRLKEGGRNSLNFQKQASEKKVLELQHQGILLNYKYVVFSCHGLIPKKEKEKTVLSPLQPALLLSTPSPEDTEEYDGILTMAEIFGLSFNADFIALSACNTGRQDKDGNITQGEGARGLTRSFMYAGTPAVSVTLWEVESNSSQIMNVSFFNYMNGGMSRAEALQEVKLEMINGEYDEDEKDKELYKHPYFWSPLVMFGDAN